MRKFIKLLALFCCVSGLSFPTNAIGNPIKVVVAGATVPGAVGEELFLRFRDNILATSSDIDLKLLIYGELGSEEQYLASLRRGRVQIGVYSGFAMTGVVPELDLLYAPFLFDSENEVDFVIDRYLTQTVSEQLAAVGLRFLRWNEIGFNHVYGKKPLLTPADTVGIRFRVALSRSAELFGKSIGADVIPVNYAELIPALETGLVDAGDTSIFVYSRSGISDNAPYLTLTAHTYAYGVIMANAQWWNSLSTIHQEVITDSLPSMNFIRRGARQSVRQDLERAAGLGIQTHDLTPTQQDAWKTATIASHAQLIDVIGGNAQNFYDRVLRGKAAFEASAKNSNKLEKSGTQ